jgi:hypothetical protein
MNMEVLGYLLISFGIFMVMYEMFFVIIWQLLDAICIIYRGYIIIGIKRNTKRNSRNKSDLEN